MSSASISAAALARSLETHHGYQVGLLLDAQATLAGLRRGLEDLATTAREDAQVLFYFAGHGLAADPAGGSAESPEGFFIPQDAREEDPATLLPMGDVYRVLQQIPCRHQMVILDCCFAGTFQFIERKVRVARGPMVLERYLRYVRDSARQQLASCAFDERALDLWAGRPVGTREPEHDEDAHSPFARALLSGLSGEATATATD